MLRSCLGRTPVALEAHMKLCPESVHGTLNSYSWAPLSFKRLESDNNRYRHPIQVLSLRAVVHSLQLSAVTEGLSEHRLLGSTMFLNQ